MTIRVGDTFLKIDSDQRRTDREVEAMAAAPVPTPEVLWRRDHLDDVLLGYGSDVDRDLIKAWWSFRCLAGVRWLFENGYGAAQELPEVAILRSLV